MGRRRGRAAGKWTRVRTCRQPPGRGVSRSRSLPVERATRWSRGVWPVSKPMLTPTWTPTGRPKSLCSGVRGALPAGSSAACRILSPSTSHVAVAKWQRSPHHAVPGRWISRPFALSRRRRTICVCTLNPISGPSASYLLRGSALYVKRALTSVTRVCRGHDLSAMGTTAGWIHVVIDPAVRLSGGRLRDLSRQQRIFLICTAVGRYL